MTYEFKLPDIGEGVAEGEVVKWLVKEGVEVKENQPLVEIMTDKVNVEIPSPRKGTILKLMAKEGEAVKVGQVLLVIGDKGEHGAPSVQMLPAQKPTSLEPKTASTQGPPVAVQKTAPIAEPKVAREILATPATRKLARDLGVDITTVQGTGPVFILDLSRSPAIADHILLSGLARGISFRHVRRPRRSIDPVA